MFLSSSHLHGGSGYLKTHAPSQATKKDATQERSKEGDKEGEESEDSSKEGAILVAIDRRVEPRYQHRRKNVGGQEVPDSPQQASGQQNGGSKQGSASRPQSAR